MSRLQLILCACCIATVQGFAAVEKPRVIVTSDGEIDDECSMVRFLLYANEWDIEGIVTSSSQYHWHGHNWAGDDWADVVISNGVINLCPDKAGAFAEIYRVLKPGGKLVLSTPNSAFWVWWYKPWCRLPAAAGNWSVPEHWSCS